MEKRGSKNNFDIIRISLAFIVFFYHIGELTGNSALKIFSGSFAVECFFVISGFLISRSYFNNYDLMSYAKSRFLRIYPLYFIVIISCFVFGLFVTELNVNEYLRTGGVEYLFYNLFFLNFLQPTLPGVFVDNVNSIAINGSLWTLKVEVLFYISVPILYGFITKWVCKKKLTIIVALTSVITFYILNYLVVKYSLNPSINNQLPSLMSYFMIGASFNFILIENKKFLLLLPVVILYLIFFYIPWVQPIAVGAGVYLVAFLFPTIKVSKRIGDISYGLYIWHFPLIQFYIHKGYFDSYIEGLIITVISVISLSYLSWHYIEKKLVHRR